MFSALFLNLFSTLLLFKTLAKLVNQCGKTEAITFWGGWNLKKEGKSARYDVMACHRGLLAVLLNKSRNLNYSIFMQLSITSVELIH